MFVLMYDCIVWCVCLCTHALRRVCMIVCLICARAHACVCQLMRVLMHGCVNVFVLMCVCINVCVLSDACIHVRVCYYGCGLLHACSNA